ALRLEKVPLMLVKTYTALTFRLCPGEGGMRHPEKIGRSFNTLSGEAGRADRGGAGQADARFDDRGLSELALDALGPGHAADGVGRGQGRDQLVAAGAGDEVVVPAGAQEGPPACDEEPVAGAAAEAAVHLVEVVDVDGHDRQRRAAPVRPGEFLVEPL